MKTSFSSVPKLQKLLKLFFMFQNSKQLQDMFYIFPYKMKNNSKTCFCNFSKPKIRLKTRFHFLNSKTVPKRVFNFSNEKVARERVFKFVKRKKNCWKTCFRFCQIYKQLEKCFSIYWMTPTGAAQAPRSYWKKSIPLGQTFFSVVWGWVFRA